MQIKTIPQKIMLVITKSNWGGAQKYVHDIACELHKDTSFEVTVLTGGNGDMVKRLKENHIRVLEIPNLIRDISFIHDIKSFLWLIATFKKESPDVIHLNSSKIGAVGAVAGRLAGIKNIVFTGHGWAFNEERPYYQKLIFRVIHLLTILLAHKTICVSEVIRKQLHAPSFLNEKCVVIHNGIPPLAFTNTQSFFDERLLIKKEKIAILSIGELHMSKGFDIALTYLAKLQNLSWEWYILGEGTKRDALEKQIHELGLNTRVFLHGHTKNAAMYIPSFDLFFIPSRTEALSYVAIEALQTNIPIISSNVGGLPEVLKKDTGTTFVDITNQETVEVLRTILSHEVVQVPPDTRKNLREEFSLSQMFQKTKAVYFS